MIEKSIIKKIFLFTALIVSFFACNPLDIPVENQLSDPDVVKDSEDFRSLLTPAYKSLPDINFTISLMASDFYPSNFAQVSNPEALKIYSWDDKALIDLADNLWMDYYKSISHINNVLARVPKNISKNENFDIRKIEKVEGEALVLKAYIYLNLANIFSDRYQDNAADNTIIIRNKTSSINIARSTKEEFRVEMINLFDKAEKLLIGKEYDDRINLNILSLYAIKTRFALFIGDIDMAEHSIASFEKLYPLSQIKVEDFNLSFWQGQKKDSQVWSYEYLRDAYYKDIFGSDMSHIERQCFLPSKELLLSKTDKRKDFYELEIKDFSNPIFGKYNIINIKKLTDSKSFAIIRSAEMLFNKMECLIRRNKFVEASDLYENYLGEKNKFAFDTIDENMLIFQNEKQKEFIGEAINFFDIKRWGVDRYSYNTSGELSKVYKSDDFRFTLPIPKSEILYNDLIKNQNKGWPSFKTEINN